jgi:GTPase
LPADRQRQHRLAIRSREGDAAAAWVTCSLGLEDETMLLGQSLGQLAQSLPDWERMATEIDAANRSVTPLTDKALAAIDEILKRMREERY